MPTSPRPYQNDFKKNSQGKDIFKQPKNMVLQTTLEGDRKEHLKRWITFFRRNPHRFVADYFGIHLYPYQILMLYILQKSSLAYIVASRASAKTWLIAVWSLTLAVLYPGIKIIVCAKTLKQGGILISEKIKQLRDTYPNVAREIQSLTANANVYEVTLHCGSTIKVVPSSDSSRGNRANYIIVEEARLVPREILEQVIKPFLEVRHPPYRLKKPYIDDDSLLEEGIISYITSAWYTAEYWYSYVRTTIRRMLDGDSTSSFMALDYLICLRHNIKTKGMLRDEMADMDTVAIQMEYLNIPAGSSSKAYYKPSMFNRNLKIAFYPQKEDTYNPKKNPYQIERVNGEIRIISVDIATRAGKANDLSIISVARLIPLLGKGYERHLVYVEAFKGVNTLTQAKRIKEIFFDFESDHMVLDIQNAGIGVFDALSKITTCEERCIDFPPFTVTDDIFIDDKIKQDLLERTLGMGALPVIYPISASQSSNSTMYSSLRNSLQKKLWKFLVPEGDAEDFLVKNNHEFSKNSIDDSNLYAYFMSPYVNTSLLISECINLDMALVGGLVKLSKKPGGYKDRFSSILYMNFIVSEFDKQLLKENEVTNDLDALMAVTFFS